MPENAPHWADAFYNARYGMGLNQKERADLQGTLPGAVRGENPQDRQAAGSAALFRQEHPDLAEVVRGPVDTIEGALPEGAPFAAPKSQIEARDRGDRAAQAVAQSFGRPVARVPFTPMGGPVAYKEPSASVTTTESDFHIPQFVAPNLPQTRPAPASSHASFPPVPQHDDPFANAFDEFQGNRNSNMSGSKFPVPQDTPLVPTLPSDVPDLGFGVVNPDMVPPTRQDVTPGLLSPADAQHQDLLGSDLTPEERSYQAYQPDPLERHLGGGLSGGSGPSMQEIMGFYGGY